MTISSKSIKKTMIATTAPSSKDTVAPKTITKITSSTKKCKNTNIVQSCFPARFCRRCRVTCTKKCYRFDFIPMKNTLYCEPKETCGKAVCSNYQLS